MARAQTNIKIPGELADELDRLAGAGRRSTYAVDVLWRDIRRARQREALKVSAGAWKAENHPELAKFQNSTTRHLSTSLPSLTGLVKKPGRTAPSQEDD